jgi:hypothetical protein
MQKGISYRMQICENPQKKCAECSIYNSFLQLAQGSLIALGAIAKGNQIHFPANCMQNPQIV